MTSVVADGRAPRGGDLCRGAGLALDRAGRAVSPGSSTSRLKTSEDERADAGRATEETNEHGAMGGERGEESVCFSREKIKLRVK